jgi:GntR family transcriptional regulator/MocR family aminotransferase
MNCLAARGLHLTVAIDNVDDQAIVQQARRFQLAPGIKPFLLDVKTARSGFVLGYGNTSASHFMAAVRTLNRLIALDRRG